MMDTFDYPEMGPNCLSRSVSTVSPQALMLMNDKHVRDLAVSFAGRVESILDQRGAASPGDQVDTVYQLALSRPPGDTERHLGIASLKELHNVWQKEPHAALETYCHTILNSAAFLYVD